MQLGLLYHINNTLAVDPFIPYNIDCHGTNCQSGKLRGTCDPSYYLPIDVCSGQINIYDKFDELSSLFVDYVSFQPLSHN